jgi:hypothetical protein
MEIFWLKKGGITNKHRNSVKPTLLNEATKTVETYIKADLGVIDYMLELKIG